MPLGFQPIAGEEFVYEMTLKCLLMPGALGVPTWQSDMIGEKLMIKLPEQFRQLFGNGKTPQLTEDIGQQLAQWAAGAPSAGASVVDGGDPDLVARYAACSDPSTLRALEEMRREVWGTLSKAGKVAVKSAADAAAARVEAASKPPSEQPPAPPELDDVDAMAARDMEPPA